MPQRNFTDSQGRTWLVWQIPPSAERRDPSQAGPFHGTDRRVFPRRGELSAEWLQGWLVFETDGQKRRASAFPANWMVLSDEQLEAICSAGVVAPARKPLSF